MNLSNFCAWLSLRCPSCQLAGLDPCYEPLLYAKLLTESGLLSDNFTDCTDAGLSEYAGTKLVAFSTTSAVFGSDVIVLGGFAACEWVY